VPSGRLRGCGGQETPSEPESLGDDDEDGDEDKEEGENNSLSPHSAT
jgi:hypothetical protein